MARAATNGKDITSEDLHAQIAALKTDIAELTNTVTAMGANETERLKQRAAAQADAIRAKGEKAIHDAGEQAAYYKHSAEEQVRQNPAAAMGIATGVGFLLGYLVTRK